MPRALTREAAVTTDPGSSLGKAFAQLVGVDEAGVLRGVDAADLGQFVAERYVALEDEGRKLSLAWQDVETWLFKKQDWPSLTQAQQAAIPEAVRLGELEEQFDLIARQRDVLLPLLKTTPACTRAGMFARLNALLSILDPQNEDARQLLRSCQADLGRLWR